MSVVLAEWLLVGYLLIPSLPPNFSPTLPPHPRQLSSPPLPTPHPTAGLAGADLSLSEGQQYVLRKSRCAQRAEWPVRCEAGGAGRILYGQRAPLCL